MDLAKTSRSVEMHAVLCPDPHTSKLTPFASAYLGLIDMLGTANRDVLFADSDLYFRRNPFEHMPDLSEYDLQISSDGQCVVLLVSQTGKAQC